MTRNAPRPSTRPFPTPFDETPVNRLLGLRVVERGASSLRMALPARAEFVQEGGVLHGGLQATLADSAAVHLLFGDSAPTRRFTSIEFKLNFLRPVLPGEQELLAEARLVRDGRKIALVEVILSQADKEVARGLFTYLYLEDERASATVPD